MDSSPSPYSSHTALLTSVTVLRATLVPFGAVVGRVLSKHERRDKIPEDLRGLEKEEEYPPETRNNCRNGFTC